VSGAAGIVVVVVDVVVEMVVVGGGAWGRFPEKAGVRARMLDT
jgi:hypothetical protein